MIKPLGTIAAAALVSSALVPSTATASPAASPAASTAVSCAMAVGSVTAAGDHQAQDVISSRPPTAATPYSVGRHVYPPGAVRVSASMSLGDDGISILFVSGYSILGDALYYANYAAPDGGPIDGSVKRVGGGWGSFVALEQTGNGAYGLRNDGTLFRWKIDAKGVWRSRTSAPGFAAVKSMALLRYTKTYDLFLANTRGGALYTILVPATAPLKPVVRLVRAATWQGFETLMAQPCGRYGFVLLGIDKDSRTGYVYAVGAPNGTSTVIQGLGKVPAKFSDPVYFHWAFVGP